MYNMTILIIHYR